MATPKLHPAMNVPQLIEGLIHKHGSINAAARAIGMPQATLHRLYNGERRPTLDSLRMIAAGLDMPLYELVRRLDGDISHLT
jgi:transcriptional regulator with XRE-family HTH domain